MMLPILQAPDDRLRQVAAPVDFADFSTVEALLPVAVEDLRDTFAGTPNCIGLAATQLGIGMRLIIVDTSRTRSQTRLMINPVITKASTDMQMVRDGCLSVQRGKWFAITRRPKRIEVAWHDEKGGGHWQKFNGTLAAAIHHEIDHLNGVLFTDKLAATSSGERP
jgi:peptide deformylase